MHLNEETYVSSQRININNKDKRIYKLKENWETWREGIRVCIDVKNNGTKGGRKEKGGDQKENLVPCLAITMRDCCVARERAREDGVGRG